MEGHLPPPPHISYMYGCINSWVSQALNDGCDDANCDLWCWYLKGIKVWKAGEMRESAGIYCCNSELQLSTIPESDRMSSSYVGRWVSKLWLLWYTPSLISPGLPQILLHTGYIICQQVGVCDEWTEHKKLKVTWWVIWTELPQNVYF
jgi:hypothetical protein